MTCLGAHSKTRPKPHETKASVAGSLSTPRGGPLASTPTHAITLCRLRKVSALGGYQPTAPASGEANTRSLLTQPWRSKDSFSKKPSVLKAGCLPNSNWMAFWNTISNSELLLQMDNIRRCRCFINNSMKDTIKNNYRLDKKPASDF